MTNILVVEDEERLRRLIKDYLKRSDYKVIEATNGEEALEILLDKKIDLVVLDIMLPKIDGYEVLKRLRLDSDIPVIMLTAKSEEGDQLKGYELGVDEYVTKPFSPKILVSKIQAVLKRFGKGKDTLIIGDLKVELKQHKIYLSNKEIILTPNEFNLLIYLIENKGIALSREKILDNVWGFDYYGDLRTVDTHIKRLRKKLENKYIITVRSIGYRFEGE